MKVSHTILKVNDLQKAVEGYREKDFAVEYGSAKWAYNTIIYFSDRPYLEPLASTGMPEMMRHLLCLSGKKEFAGRLDLWDIHEGGPCGLALEGYEPNLEREKKLLDQVKQKYVVMPSRGDDTKGHRLRFTYLFPDDLQIPFLMAYFNIGPEPKSFVHPNGVKRICSVSFGTSKRRIPLICALCNDPALVLFEGNGIHNIELEYESGGTRMLIGNWKVPETTESSPRFFYL